MYGKHEAGKVCIRGQSRLVSTLADSLFRWNEAEADATKTLNLCPRNQKVLFRRGKARKELGKWDQARAGKGSGAVSKASTLNVDKAVRHSDVHQQRWRSNARCSRAQGHRRR